MCLVVGIRKKIVYCFRVICVILFFNVGVDEKLICECMGYCLNVFF